MKKHLLPALGLLLLATACQKEDFGSEENPTPTPTPTPEVSMADRIKDTTLLYSKDIYLWAHQIPTTFDARSHADPAAIMKALRAFAIEPGFSTSVDRWSFAVGQQEWDNVSEGVAADFGLNVFFRDEGDLRVRAVERESPAGLAGIRRGWRITKIGGSSNITTANANFIVQQVYQSNSSSFTFQKPDGSTVDLTLRAADYQSDPVVKDSVYTVEDKKIGYFAFGSFLGDTTHMYNSFNRIFNNFASQGVQDVVIDLRYNGGGYVTVAEKMANFLAPSAANGGVMMTQKFNTAYTNYNSTELFKKQGSLNLSRIFFIVSNGTASASELLINSLKPYMEVALVGPSKTHGKPVGYFPIPIQNWYILPVSFLTVNKNGEGNYYQGMALNHQVNDGLDKDWGDLTESSLASVVGYITTGQYRGAARGRSSEKLQAPAVIEGNRTLDRPFFKGAVDVRGMK